MPNQYSSGHGKINFKSNAQMVLWDKSDYGSVKLHFLKCQQLSLDVERQAKVAQKLYRIYCDKFNSKTATRTDKRRYDAALFRYESSVTLLNQQIDKLETNTKKYKYADKKNGFELGRNIVHPDKITIQENSLVNPALKIYAKQIANAGTEEFRYVSSGKSSLPTTPEMNRLIDENSRLDIFVNGGFRNPNGDVVREGVVFPPALDDALIKEFGSFTSPQEDSGTMQWRNVIDVPSEQLEHDQGQTFYSIAHVTILEITFIE